MPAWLFKTDENVTYPDDPDRVYSNYTQDNELVDPTMKELGDYYERLVSWYVKGGFTDELGAQHKSGHHFKFDYWEVFNEIEADSNTRQLPNSTTRDTMLLLRLCGRSV